MGTIADYNPQPGDIWEFNSINDQRMFTVTLGKERLGIAPNVLRGFEIDNILIKDKGSIRLEWINISHWDDSDPYGRTWQKHRVLPAKTRWELIE